MTDFDVSETEDAFSPLGHSPRVRMVGHRAPKRMAELVRREPWRSSVRGATIFAILALAYWLLAPRTFQARAVAAPSARAESSRLPASLSGLAGQLGISASADPTTTPVFYALLAHSQTIQRQVLFASLTTRSDGLQSRPVWRALGIEPCDSLCILRRGLPKIDAAVDVVVDRQTGTFTIAAVLRDPDDAAAVVKLYLKAIDSYNRGVRASQARASRAFLEGRVAAVRDELRDAEDRLQLFYERNASAQLSPRLRFEEGRLRRDVDARTELLTNLVRQLESARLDEVNSMPLLSIVDSATPPLRKHSPRGLPIVLSAVVAGGLLGAALGLARLRPAPEPQDIA